jgi:hypothetical protein
VRRAREPVDARAETRNARLAAACGWVQGVYEAHWDGDGKPPSIRPGWARGPYTRTDAADYDDDAQLYDLLGLACERGWAVDITVPRHGWVEVYAERTGRWEVAYGASSIGRALAPCMLDGLSLDAQAACDADDEDDEDDDG